jgi:hypothetical protein
MNGRQPGGPDKAADAIIGAVESDAPPLRLVLGKYANDKVRKKLFAYYDPPWTPVFLRMEMTPGHR